MRICILGAVFALFMASNASAAPADRKADWLKKPTPEQLLAVVPSEAARRGIDGSAVISCAVTVQGSLRDCKIRSETPAGMGFGAAALTLAPQLLMSPTIRNGAPVEDQVMVPISFRGLSRASDQFGSARVISNVPWSKAPTVTDFMAAYPVKAKSAKKSGHATLDCALDEAGGLTQCRALREEPRGFGFAEAAKSLAPKFMAPESDSAGRSLKGAHTQVPFTFAAEALEDASPPIGKPHWIALPTTKDFTDVFPDAASKAGVLQARVVLSCMVSEGGVLTGCRIESEAPGGYGFGAGAQTLVGKFRVTIWSDDGLPVVGGSLQVPIRYDLKQAPPPAAPAKP